ncbi:unnamed protein product (macronuclear) [Paramecium tetraurelia]|uniref:Transmembrane protein n=1 Tax=Paramecium tetraurelia TaxID=5888 RepID=A0CAW9_PARTE|nr:uncharacterized protein GSPATT00036717001 [Paramecium tetraurelia]CAK67936.1 unnamed protein product [Paramecium tetraurelia]|eukprot:XP_001435333.1 hypothetical protein (macronuclear) [Paramecium tetraurelia strain d4-2]
MFILICILVLTYSIQVPIEETENIEVLQLVSSEQFQEQQLKKVQNTQQVFLLEIANYLEGTTINTLLGKIAQQPQACKAKITNPSELQLQLYSQSYQLLFVVFSFN